MVNYVYLNSLRSAARRLGIIRLISLPAQARVLWRIFEYGRVRPKQTELEVHGIRIAMHVADDVEYSRICSFRDDRRILETIIKHLSPGNTYWDVGGSIGLYACIVAQAVGPTGRVISFEPERRSFERLSQNVELNHLSNIRLLKLALGQKKDQLRLHVSQSASAGTHTLYPSATNQSELTELVDVLPGDDVRKRENLPVPTLIKVDVEGAEEEVFNGLKETLRNPECRAVLCEVHFSLLEQRGSAEAPGRIQALLKESGFTTAWWIDHSHYFATKNGKS